MLFRSADFEHFYVLEKRARHAIRKPNYVIAAAVILDFQYGRVELLRRLVSRPIRQELNRFDFRIAEYLDTDILPDVNLLVVRNDFTERLRAVIRSAVLDVHPAVSESIGQVGFIAVYAVNSSALDVRGGSNELLSNCGLSLVSANSQIIDLLIARRVVINTAG